MPWLISALKHVSQNGLQIDTLRIRSKTLADHRRVDDDQDEFVRLIATLRNVKNLQVQWGFVCDGLETSLLWRGAAAQSKSKIDVYEELIKQALSELTSRRTVLGAEAEEESIDHATRSSIGMFQSRMAELMRETGLAFVDEAEGEE